MHFTATEVLVELYKKEGDVVEPDQLQIDR